MEADQPVRQAADALVQPELADARGGVAEAGRHIGLMCDLVVQLGDDHGGPGGDVGGRLGRHGELGRGLSLHPVHDGTDRGGLAVAAFLGRHFGDLPGEAVAEHAARLVCGCLCLGNIEP